MARGVYTAGSVKRPFKSDSSAEKQEKFCWVNLSSWADLGDFCARCLGFFSPLPLPPVQPCLKHATYPTRCKLIYIYIFNLYNNYPELLHDSGLSLKHSIKTLSLLSRERKVYSTNKSACWNFGRNEIGGSIGLDKNGGRWAGLPEEHPI